MKNEESGVIVKLFDTNSGVIQSIDEKQYHFSKIDFLHNETIELGKKVLFKPYVYNLNGYFVYKAVYISYQQWKRVPNIRNSFYSTVTDFAKFFGLSTLHSLKTAAS